MTALSPLQIAKLKPAIEHAISVWDRRQRNHHAGALALLRWDEVCAEIEQGADPCQAISDGFNDRLRDRLLVTLRATCP